MTARRTRTAPYRVGVLGCGAIAPAHVKAWSRISRARVAYAFDLDAKRAADIARLEPGLLVAESTEHLIEECDVVSVCTPPQTHAAVAIQVLEADRHLLIEKPVVMSPAEWNTVRAEEARSEGTVTVVHNLKFTRAVQRAKRWVDEGQIGELIGLSRAFLTDPGTDRMLAGEHWSHALPGGRWFETLPHALYLTHMFAGPARLERVWATAGDFPHLETKMAGEVGIELRAGDSVAEVRYSGRCSLNRRTLTLQGTTGRIEVDLLGDAAFLSKVPDSRLGRAVGRPFLESASRMVNFVPDRLAYMTAKLSGRSPHYRLIRAVDRFLAGTGPAPTPVEEIEFVVQNADAIGRAIDARLEQETEYSVGTSSGAVAL